MSVKKRVTILRILLTALCLLVYAWIFSNSATVGAQSSAQSHSVTKTVQKIVGVFAPDSFIATAAGEDFDRLHSAIRTLAHFCEFALLGALLTWCYASYTRDKAFAFLPVALVVLTPIFDEAVQSFTGGRAAEVADLLVDTAGGLAGCVFALVTLWIGFAVSRRKKKKKV
ncbi:MAG: VanZ family protein [Clostridia bacterium]|nr:VanZ family protein [Clostridia bacterium]